MLFEPNPTPADKAALQAIGELVNAKKLGDVKKICKKSLITQTAFADLITACESGVLRPWIHQISHRDFMPNWQWTDVERSKFVTKNEEKSSTPIFAYFARQFREARLMESS
jgi:hypothetical protein